MSEDQETLLVADNTTGYIGVRIANPGRLKPFRAEVKRDGKMVSLGSFAIGRWKRYTKKRMGWYNAQQRLRWTRASSPAYWRMLRAHGLSVAQIRNILSDNWGS